MYFQNVIRIYVITSKEMNYTTMDENGNDTMVKSDTQTSKNTRVAKRRINNNYTQRLIEMLFSVAKDESLILGGMRQT